MVVIPDTTNGYPVTTIGGYYEIYYGQSSWSGAFEGSTSVTSVTIGTNVTSIAEEAFNGCLSLSNIIIGTGVTNIGYEAFVGCPLTSLTIPNSVTDIGGYAFYNCGSLTSVMIPSSVTNIGVGAFAACPGLTVITVDINNSVYSSLAGLVQQEPSHAHPISGWRAGTTRFPTVSPASGRRRLKVRQLD